MNKNKIRSIKTAAKGYAFIGINLIGVLIFWTIPLIFSFIISISKWDIRLISTIYCKHCSYFSSMACIIFK